MKRVLITGITGLVGDGIGRYFLRNDWEVCGTSRRALESYDSKFFPLKLDLGSKDDLEILSKHGPYRAVVHNAAKLPHGSVSDEDADSYYSCNVKGTRYLLEWAEKSDINTFVYISGTGVFNSKKSIETEESQFSPKSNHYHLSKAMGELLCEMYNARDHLRTVVLRISAPYGHVGRNVAVMPKFIDHAKSDKDIELWGNGTRSQIFTFVEDVGHACRLAIEKPAAHGVYNIASNESTTMKELANKVLEVFPNSKSRIILSGDKDPQDGQVREISIAKAKRELDFKPHFELSAGLKKIAEDSNGAFWRLQAP